MRLSERIRCYEEVCKETFLRRTPVIVRLDGRGFREKTRGLEKPIDRRIQRSMDYAARVVCEELQICVASLQFSDEVSFFINDVREQTAKFAYNKQHILSVIVSTFTAVFNEAMRKEFPDNNWRFTFEAKCFSIPFVDITGYACWRQSICQSGVLRSLAANIGGAKYSSGSYEEVKEFVSSLGIDFDSWSIGDQFGHWCLREGDSIAQPKDFCVIFNREACDHLRSLFKNTIYWDLEISENDKEQQISTS